MMVAPVSAGAILHAGCGRAPLPEWLDGQETRLDISPDCNPDVLASMADIGEIGPFNTVYTSHSLEHLSPSDVPRALAGFYRVLEPGGALVIIVPDIEDARPTEDVLFVTSAGPITGLDLIYGHRASLDSMPYMAHRSGFTADLLQGALEAAGFETIKTRRMSNYNLMAVARK